MKHHSSLTIAALGVTVALLNFIVGSLLVAQEVTNPSSAETELTDSVLKDRLIAECEDSGLPAMWAGIFYTDGRPTIVEAAGKRKWGSADMANADDIVHLGSCTKAMTAAIIGQLCTEGKLELDTTLGEIFSDVPSVSASEWGAVTIRELLQHRSGAVANFMIYQSFDKSHPDSVVAARQALLEALCKNKRPRNPKFVYSNVGYIVLGHVAEGLEGKPWEEIIAERLFKPLGMTSAGFGPVGKPDGIADGAPSISDRAWGHRDAVGLFSLANSLLGGEAKPDYTPIQLDNSRCLGPAGRVHLSLRDWSKFVLAFARDDGYLQLNISAEVWKELLTPAQAVDPNESYAGGWIIFDKPAYGGRAFFHNGSNTTWYSYALALPGKDACILVATNAFNDTARKACDQVARFMNEEVTE